MLQVQFKILTIVGIWCPPNWISNWKKKLYNLYSIFVSALIYAVGLSQLACIFFVRQDFKEFIDIFFILVSTNFSCFKSTCSLLFRKRIIHLINMFKEDCCVPRNLDEKNIQRKYDDVCRMISLGLLTLAEMTALFMIIIPLRNSKEQKFIFKVLMPYNMSTPLNYWLTFVHHSLSIVILAAISLMNDAMIVGFMLQVCSQLKLLEYRITDLPSHMIKAYNKNKYEINKRKFERLMLREIIQHHVQIFKIAETICMTFYEIIFCQFFISGLVICVSVYQISVATVNKVELITYILYLICMLQQFFVYCYFGNEVSIQSKSFNNAVFGIYWVPMSIEMKQDLSIIILRSFKPIDMSCGSFIHLTLESFTNIVKTSYSVFNILKQSM